MKIIFSISGKITAIFIMRIAGYLLSLPLNFLTSYFLLPKK
jgi:hypothetical protein